MSLNNTVARLFSLKNKGVHLERALDIGAYRGEFTNTLQSIWPQIKVQQFDADVRNKPYLNDDAFIGVLGNINGKVDLFTIEDTHWGSTTGTSIFRENTIHYVDPMTYQAEMTTLDAVVDLSGDWSKGLVKIDTQGSELLILEGAKQLLSKRPRFILLECSFIEYNRGAPLITETFQYMNAIKYKPVDVFEFNYIDDTLVQGDFLFEML